MTKRGMLIPIVLAAVAFACATWLHQSRLQSDRLEMLGMRLPLQRALHEATEYSSTAAAGGQETLLVSDQRMGLADIPRRAAALSLGGFRGFYAVYLWSTVEENKNLSIHEDLLDKYYRIANLQPDYPSVYSYHGWNLAWNLSTQWATVERRYDWIRHGINFLREGITRNPDALELYETMGRIYYMRIADSTNKADVEYMTQRVLEEDGAKPLLMAYRWYRQARRVQDETGQRHPQFGPHMLAQQSCFAINTYAKETTAEMLESMREAVGMHFSGQTEEAQQLVAEMRPQMDEILNAWQTTVSEWQRQAEQYPEQYNAARFLDGAKRALAIVERLHEQLRPENLQENPQEFRALVVQAENEPLLIRQYHWADDRPTLRALP